jgi:hypothetical protein
MQIVEREEEVCGLLSGDDNGEWAEWAERMERNCVVWDEYEGGLQGVQDGYRV